MCNALSPEKALMWLALYEGRADPALRREHFTHATYRRWFDALAALRATRIPLSEDTIRAQVSNMGHEMDSRDRRALKRMLRVPPPPRVLASRDLLVRALADRHAGRRMHIERLIN